MPSRNIADLHESFQPFADAFIKACENRKVEVIVYCTLRTNEEQARLYRNGRTLARIQDKAKELEEKYHRPDLAKLLIDVGPQHGSKIVTNAGPGQSLHNYGFALDAAPMRDGKIVWGEDDPLWVKYGLAAYDAQLEWAGDWVKFKEYPHVQMPDVSWKQLIKEV